MRHRRTRFWAVVLMGVGLILLVALFAVALAVID
jgi:hypothetical protein